jgi:hypothetical protein
MEVDEAFAMKSSVLRRMTIEWEFAEGDVI